MVHDPKYNSLARFATQTRCCLWRRAWRSQSRQPSVVFGRSWIGFATREINSCTCSSTSSAIRDWYIIVTSACFVYEQGDVNGAVQWKESSIMDQVVHYSSSPPLFAGRVDSLYDIRGTSSVLCSYLNRECPTSWQWVQPSYMVSVKTYEKTPA